MPLPSRVIVILDVGHGNSAVIKDESGTVIIDAGPKSTLLEFLTEQGIDQIDSLLISHADQDHIGGIVAILASGRFIVNKVRLNTDSIKGSDIWDDLLYELDRMAFKEKLDFRPSLTITDSGTFDLATFRIEILGPSNYLAGKGPGSNDRSGRRISTNSISAAIRILTKENVPLLLLPGDIDEIGLDDIINHGVNATSPIMVYPHHGGLPGSHEIVEEFTHRLFNLITPSVVIFSIERGESYRNPRPEIITTLINQSGKVRIMCTQLSGQCAARLPLKSPPHLANVYAKGKEECKCCAGTIIIDPSLPDPISPMVNQHQEFINLTAPTALCRHN
jgi:beta-lactamase superfamily II metal-dependent hydrolase